MTHQVKKSINSILTLSLLVISSSAFAEQVDICKRYFEKKELRCIIKADTDRQPELGDQVILYTKDAHWVATGEIVAKKTDFVVAVFEGTDPNIQRGLTAEFENSSDRDTLNYNMAFASP